MTKKVKFLYPLVFQVVLNRICSEQTTQKMKLALYQIHVQKIPVPTVISNLELSKSSVYKYEKNMDKEILYYRTFLKTHKEEGKAKAYSIIFDNICSRKNTDANLRLALYDVFVKKVTIGTVIDKYQVSRSTIYRRAKSVEEELEYFKRISKLIRHSRTHQK